MYTKYTILDTEYTTTIITKVEYINDDNETEILEIAHFQPESIEEIEQNIQNRFESISLQKQLDKEAQ